MAIAPGAIYAEAMATAGVMNCHDIASAASSVSRCSSRCIWLLTPTTSAHRITEQVEERLEESYGPVRCTIHLEPKEYVEEGITYTGAHG